MMRPIRTGRIHSESHPGTGSTRTVPGRDVRPATSSSVRMGLRLS